MTYTKELLRLFPTKRIKPVDGMAVTADVWEEAHDYHRNLMRYHALFNHGTGIVTGLEVIARDPTDSMVYVLPGIAVDSVGRTIIMPEPFAYDFGEGEGILYLLLTHQEGRPQNRNGREDSPLYVMAGYGLEAVSKRPSTPYVELARLNRTSPNAPIQNADDKTHPLANRIDVRYREDIGAQIQPALTIGVMDIWITSDRFTDTIHQSEDHFQESLPQRGIRILARSLRKGAGQQVWADLTVSPQDNLDRYALLYLKVSDIESFVNQSTDKYETEVLYDYLQNGGTILAELADVRTDITQSQFSSLSERLGRQFNQPINQIEAGHPLLELPHFFAKMPVDEQREQISYMAEGGGLLLSSCGYGHRWAGMGINGPISREEIRTAIEWGENLLHYSGQRRKQQ